MTNALTIVRSLIIYSLCLPLAIFLGYLLAMPMDPVSFTIVLITASLPLIPVLLRWHHLLLVASWNVSMVLFFLPGRPNLWIALAAASLLISVLRQILHRDNKFISVPSVTRPLIFLVIVIVITAKLTGGIGLRTMGGDTIGGKRYIFLLAAIAGYFAITYERVPAGRAPLYFGLYILGYVTLVIGSLAPFFDRSFYFLFILFPVENLRALSAGDDGGPDVALRLGGLAFGCVAIVYFVLARHGVRGLFDLSERWNFLPFRFRGGLAVNQPWRMLIFLFMIWMSLLGGYRSIAIGLAITFLIQFYLEGMYRTPVLPVLMLCFIVAAAVSLPLIHKLPMSIQRSLSFLPLDVDPVARYSAEASSEWRKAIWREVIPTIPQYLILGKGYAINPGELEAVRIGAARSASDGGGGAILAGDYHNGPLSVIIPLGIFGALGFLWFLVASFRVLLYNYRYADADLKLINTFLLSLFAARVISFIFVFGSLYAEMASFTGLIAFSICLNGGMKRPVLVPVEKQTFNQFKLARAAK